MDMTAEEFLNKKYDGKGYSAKVHDWNKSTHYNIVLPNLLEEYSSIKTKELKKQLQKEAMNQLSLLDQIKELEEENKKLRNKLETIILTISEDYDSEKEMNGEIEFVEDTLIYLNEQLHLINTK